jgi:hypothetical protein
VLRRRSLKLFVTHLLQNLTKFIKKLRGNFVTQILCLFDFFTGFVVISLQVVNSPPVVIGLREPWVYVKCVLVIRKRLIILAFISIGISPIGDIGASIVSNAQGPFGTKWSNDLYLPCPDGF